VTALLATATYTVDPWDPGYGVAYGDELDGREPRVALDLDVELPAASWRAVSPAHTAALPSSVLFLDGVRRIDARVWVHGVAPQPVPAIAASLAAGLVRCDGTARIVDVRMDRSLYTSAAGARDLDTRHATYTVRPSRAGRPDDDLVLAVQRRLAELEVELATAWQTAWQSERPAGSAVDGLLVVDGPLRGHATHVAGAVGYVKTHHVPYLPPDQAAVVAGMAAGERSPVFAMTTSWRRYSWYLRLAERSAGGSAAPWSGVVRLECSADLAAAGAVALADLTARLLPPFASTPHKDPRAPQNLVPIGGLERQLRHRLGDPALLYRALRAAARES
jgi:hypothetical protein